MRAPTYANVEPGALLIRVKAVPGASRDQIAGAVGDRLKIRVAAPPEAGKANKAVRKLLAGTVGVRAADVAIESGETSPLKLIRILTDDPERALGALLKAAAG